jgi:hypothetical protein
MAGKRDEAKCAARGGMTKSEVHAAVFARDAGCCTTCGMSDEQHTRTYGRGIQVHRREPGSLYTVEGCVLLCCQCHKGEAKRTPGTPDAEQVSRSCFVRLPEEYHAALSKLAKSERRAISWQLIIALNEHFVANGLPELLKPWAKD